MGCGISTSNLPSYMRGGRIPAIKKTSQLDDDQNIAIIDRHNNDSANADKTNVSSSPVKNHLKVDTGDEKKPGIQKNNNIKPVSITKEMNNREDHDNEEEEEYLSVIDDARSSNIGNMSWVGSPSFREYCDTQYDSTDEDDKSDEENKNVKETKAEGTDLRHASRKPNEGSIETRRSSRLRKVFPIGKSSAMKNILNVATCYNPSHATSRDQKS